MPYFNFKARDKKGNLVKEKASAESREDMLERIKSRGLTPVEVTESQTAPQAADNEKKTTVHKGLMSSTVSEQEKGFLTKQFSTMLRAGLSMDRILTILHKQAKSQRLKDVLYQVAEDIQKGATLKDSFEKHPDVFDGMYVSMVAIGEKSGNLPEIFQRLHRVIESKINTGKRLKSAMAYPLFVLCFSLILSYVLLVVFMPGFLPMFKGIGVNINQDYPLTAALLKLSKIVSNKGDVIGFIVVVLLMVTGLRYYYTTAGGRKFFDSLALSIPGFNALLKHSAVSSFCRSLSYMSRSGVPLLDSLGIIARGSGNVVFGKSVQNIANKVNEGSSMSEVIEKDKLFPDIVAQMVKVGEQSGSVPEMLEQTANYLDEGLDDTVNAVTSLMEPAMMICVGLIVGTFILGILMPIFDLSSKLNQ